MITLDELAELAARQLAAMCRKAADHLDPPPSQDPEPPVAASPGSEGQGLDEWFTSTMAATNMNYTSTQVPPVTITWATPPGT